jgi:hypothetical protein
VPSSLEIAQQATLRPIAEIAADAGLEPDEIEFYGRYKAKVNLSALDKRAAGADGKLVCVTAITPTRAGEGKTTTSVSLTQGLGAVGAKPVLCLREPSLGPQPSLHRRPARDRRGEQPAGDDPRGAHPARELDRHRSAERHLAALHGHERPGPS